MNADVTTELAMFLDNNDLPGFSLEILLPSQWADDHRSTERPPEQRLVIAILEDALSCWMKRNTPLPGDINPTENIDYKNPITVRNIRLREEADAWIFDRRAAPLFSFINICDMLAIDPNYLREALKNWQNSSVTTVPKSRRMPVPKKRYSPEEAAHIIKKIRYFHNRRHSLKRAASIVAREHHITPAAATSIWEAARRKQKSKGDIYQLRGRST